MYFFIVETKGRSLEETAALFDGEEKAQELHAKAVADAGLAGAPKGQRTPSLEEKGSDDIIEHHKA